MVIVSATKFPSIKFVLSIIITIISPVMLGLFCLNGGWQGGFYKLMWLSACGPRGSLNF